MSLDRKLRGVSAQPVRPVHGLARQHVPPVPVVLQSDPAQRIVPRPSAGVPVLPGELHGWCDVALPDGLYVRDDQNLRGLENG